MLARANRIVRASDYRTTIRRGRKVAGGNTVVYLREQNAPPAENLIGPPRFGFVVAKTVGNAVTRNRVRRRLKAIGYELVVSNALGDGVDVVIRALPGSAHATFGQLEGEVTEALKRARVA